MEPRKAPSVSLVMTVFGATLFVPPLVRLASGPVRWFGIPAEVFYMFLVWLALVVGTALLSRLLPRAPAGEGDNEP